MTKVVDHTSLVIKDNLFFSSLGLCWSEQRWAFVTLCLLVRTTDRAWLVVFRANLADIITLSINFVTGGFAAKCSFLKLVFQPDYLVTL